MPRSSGDAVRPQRGRPAGLTAQHGRRRPQRPVGEEHAPGQALEEMRLIGADAEVMQLNLGLRPGQRGRAREGGRIAVLVGQVQRRLPAGRDQRREGHADGRSGLDAHPLPQADDRIQDRPGGIAERPALARRRAADLMAAPEEPGAVGLPL